MKSSLLLLTCVGSITLAPFSVSAQVQQAWVARYSGPNGPQDGAAALAVDAEGNVHVTGPAVGGYATLKYGPTGNRLWLARTDSGFAMGLVLDATGNVFVTGEAGTIKYSPDGQELWRATEVGGIAIVITADGNACVTGRSWSPDGAPSDFLTAKYAPDGQLLWLARYNGPASREDMPVALGLDAGGNVLVCGRSSQSEYVSDIATVKYSADGQQLWVARHGGLPNGFNQPTAMAIDAAGSAYVTGVSSDSSCEGVSPGFSTIKYDANGQKLWVAGYSTVQVQGGAATANAVDAEGNVFVVGWAPTGCCSVDDFVIVKFDSNGRQLWSSRYRSEFVTELARDTGRHVSLVLDSQGNAYVAGAGGNGYATLKFDSAGNRLWAISYPGLTTGDIDSPNAIAVDGSGNVFVTGQSDHQTYHGDGEFATVKYVQTAVAGTPRIISPPSSQLINQGAAITLSVTATGEAPLNYQWFRRGLPGPGATGASLHISSAHPANDPGWYWVEVSNHLGVVASPEARVVVQVPPSLSSISFQPPTGRILPGETVSLTASAGGQNLSYQWRHNGVEIPGATSCSLLLTNAHVAQSGGYTVVVSNALGVVTSSVATVSIGIPSVVSPRSQSVVAGRDVTLSVGASGPGPLSYQWYFNAAPLPAASSNSLALRGVSNIHAGAYYVVVANSYGAVTSAVATLTVHPAMPALDTWQERNPKGEASYLSDITYANSTFFAVGWSGGWPDVKGALVTSSDGAAWTVHSIAMTAFLNGIAYGNGVLVAVGSTYTNSTYNPQILTSPNGVDWTTRQVGSGYFLSDVTYGNGTFVAVGNLSPQAGSVILISPDGVTWTQRPSSTAGRLFDVTYGNGVFVAVGNRILTSTDGAAWVDRGPTGLDDARSAVAHSDGLFVVNGASLLTSSNGINWVARGGGGYSAIAFGNDTLVAVSVRTTCNEDECYSTWSFQTATNVANSIDALNWRNTTLPGGHSSSALTFAAGRFVAVASTAGIYTSPDGFQWANHSPFFDKPLDAVAFGDGRFVAVGLQGTILTSHNGASWTNVASGNFGSLAGVASGGGKIVAVGTSSLFSQGNPQILTSTDTANWTAHTVATNGRLRAVAYGNGLFVAVGDNSRGIILTSVDGLNWIPGTSGAPDQLHGIAFGSGVFVIAGATYVNGTYVPVILYSADGLNWTRRNLPGPGTPLAIAHGNGRFVAVGSGGLGSGGFWSSDDAVSWNRTAAPPSRPLRDVAFGNGYFVAVGGDPDGIILTSRDGIAWIQRYLGSFPRMLNGVAFGRNSFVAVGGFDDPNSALILQSGAFSAYYVTMQPEGPLVPPGSTVTFAAATPGVTPISYQWRFNSTYLPGATNATLTLADVQPANSGLYAVLVTDVAGTELSEPATLTVLGAPVLFQQPQSLTVRAGENATFSVTAISRSPISYQWRCDGVDLSGATSTSLTITNVQPFHEGQYTVRVMDALGAVVSDKARLTVLSPPVIPVMVQPVPPLFLTAAPGETVTLGAALRGPAPIFARWRKFNLNGLHAGVIAEHVVTSGTDFLVLTNLTTNHAGTYTLALTNIIGGSLISLRTNAILTVLSDRDGDRLTDDWELAHGFNPDDAGDATLDSDGDGLSNRQEYLAGTDPRDAQSYLKVDAIEQAGAPWVRLHFLAVSNRTYAVEWRESADSGSWAGLADVMAAATNRVVEITDTKPAAAGRERFYRLRTP